MFIPLAATMPRLTPAGELIKINVTVGSGKIYTRLITYVGMSVFGGYREVLGAARDVTEWPHDVVPKRPDGTPEVVYVMAWNQATEADGQVSGSNEVAASHFGWAWDDSKGCTVPRVGAFKQQLLYSYVLN